MKQNFFFLILSVLFLVPFVFANDITTCSANSYVNTTCLCAISDLHPTQISVGMLEVNEKEKAIKKMRNDELDQFELKNPEPTVVGSMGKLFIIDHHHLARALLNQGVKFTYCQIVDNFSKLDFSQFWITMNQKLWVYSYDENGNGPLSFSALPDSINGLKDDPYRSLAGAVRKAGGYDKTSEAFAEFQWANFFRSRINKEEIQDHFERAIINGVRFAQMPEASSLPGYHKR